VAQGRKNRLENLRPQVEPQAPGGDTGDVEKGGKIVITSYQTQDSIDPNVWTATSMTRYMASVFDPLIWQPEPNKFVAGLAVSWEPSEDLKEWTFELREDVKFHNGEKFTADAVKFTLDRIVDPEAKSLRAGDLANYVETEVVDDHTCIIKFSKPEPRLLLKLSHVGFAPLSPKAVEELGSDYALNPVGTGPFMVKEWPDPNTLVLERFEDYNWAPDFMNHQGPAYLEQITVKMIEEGATRVAALESGQAHYIDNVPSQDLERLDNADGVSVVSFANPGMPILMPINVQKAPTDDLFVRKAILYAVDQERMNELVFQGYQTPAYGPLSSVTFGYWDGVEDMYPYSLEKSGEMLEEAGYSFSDSTGFYEKNGEPITVVHATSSSSANGGEAEMLQAFLAEAGIKDEVKGMAYEARAQLYAQGEYNLARIGWTSIDPQFVFNTGFHSSQVTGGGQFNRSRVQDSKIDALIAEAEVLTDEQRLKEIYKELQEYIMDQALAIPSREIVGWSALKDSVKGYDVNLQDHPYWYQVWIEE